MLDLGYGSKDIPAVPDSPEFRRIIALPRRVLPTPTAGVIPPFPQIPDYRTELGMGAGHWYKYWQAVALHELYWNRGLFAALPVGVGKTLITFLAAHICALLGAARTVLVIPAMAQEKTEKEFKVLARFWRQAQPMPVIITYSALTLKHNVRLLQTIRPKAMLFDECDQLRKLEEGSAPVRVDRYMQEFPDTICAATTGTIGRKSYKDFAHILRWCLKGGSPLPLSEGPLWQWCQALDDDDVIGGGRWRPGVLMSFARPIDPAAAAIERDPWMGDGGLARARAGVLEHMRNTPGVLIVDESTCDKDIHIDFLHAPTDPLIDEAFYKFRKTKETPDGYMLTDNLSIFNHTDELGQGFYSRWDPRAPAEWLSDRRDWATYVNEQIDATRKTRFPLDTEGAVAEAHPEHPALLQWKQTEPTFIPNPVQTWYSASVVYAAAEWVRHWEAQGEHVLVWVRSKAMAQGLMSSTSLPYYGAQGKRHDELFRKMPRESIENAKLGPNGEATHSAILSFDANYRVRNLQRYSRALIIGWEGSADRVEQWLGRMHRQNQERDCHYTILLTSGETVDAFAKTLAEARGVQARNGHTQKVLQAVIHPRDTSVEHHQPRWRVKREEADEFAR